MATGLTTHLAATYGLVMLAVLLIARRHLPFPVAAALALVRVAIPVAYFAFFADGRWGIIDDRTYFDQARQLVDGGFTPWSALTTPSGLAMLFGLSGGFHIGFLWWNLLLAWSFGAEYHVLVAANVVLGVLVAECTARLALRAGFERPYVRGLFAFVALHWDLVAWSSFLNIKDVLISFLELVVLLRLSAFSQARAGGARAAHVAVLAPLGIALFFLRFYVPVLLAGAMLLSVLLVDAQLRRRLAIVVVLATPVIALSVRRMLPTLLEFAIPAQLPTGIVRAIASPQPWSVAVDHGFLLLPAWLHLLTLPLLALGAWRLWQEARPTRVVMLFMVVAVGFYGLVPELQGPRQRLQVSFVLAWAQYHGALAALAALRRRHLEPATLAVPA